MRERAAAAAVPRSLSSDAPQPVPFIGVGFKGPIVPDLGFDVVIVDFVDTICVDELREFFHRVNGRSSVPLEVEPSEIIERNLVETVGAGEADVVPGKIREGDPDLVRVLVLEVVGAGMYRS